jgi:hypothetical protein
LTKRFTVLAVLWIFFFERLEANKKNFFSGGRGL